MRNHQVTHLGTHLFIKDNSNVCTMLLIFVGNHNRLCSNCYKLMRIQRLQTTLITPKLSLLQCIFIVIDL